MSLFLTILGLIIGSISLITVIELFPRLSATPTAPFDHGSQFASFQVSNDGYLRVGDVEVGCFIWRARMFNADFQNVLTNSTLLPKLDQLNVGDSYTIDCRNLVYGPPQTIQRLDLAIFVHYRPWPWPFSLIRRTRVFRFTASPGVNGMNWYKQPPEPLLDDLNQALKHGHPPSQL
jgi:hypothetical protein